MLSKFQNYIQDLTKQVPNWDNDVVDILSDEAQSDNNGIKKQSLDKFTELLKEIVNEANSNDVPVEEVLSLFKAYKCKDFASVFIKRKMQTFNAFKVLRDLEKTDPYKAKFCIDLIWNSYVLRYDPYLDIKTQSPINENEYISLASRLDAFADICVARQLCVSAISRELKEETGLSNEICKYITEKIDNDLEKLKLNFIIERLAYENNKI